jgi:hypothetical protein
MSTLQTYVTQVQRLVHDASNANFSTAELTDYINEAREDVALDMHCVRTFVTGVPLPIGQEVYPLTTCFAGATPSVTNVFQVISISNIWNNERYTLSFRGFTLFQAYFRSWNTTFNSRPGVWTIHQQMLQVYLRPAPDQIYLSEWDVLSLPTPLVNLTDVDSQVMPPWNKVVQFRAAALALMKNQNFEQAQYYDAKYDQRVPKYIIGAGGIRIPNPYNRSFQRRVARG